MALFRTAPVRRGPRLPGGGWRWGVSFAALLVTLLALLPLGFVVAVTLQTGWQTASAPSEHSCSQRSMRAELWSGPWPS